MRLACGSVVNKSVDFSFWLAWLLLVGCDVEHITKRVRFSACGFGEVKTVFKAERVRARGHYFLVNLTSETKVVYASLKLKIGDVVLFAPYGAYVPRYSYSSDRVFV